MKTILVDAVNTFIASAGDGWAIDADMYALLELLPHRKIILTNANDAQKITFGLDKVPYPVFTLNGAPWKTDPSYYQTFLTDYGLHAADVIYFEHNPDACQSARQNGIVTYHFDPQKRDLTALRAFLTAHL